MLTDKFPLFITLNCLHLVSKLNDRQLPFPPLHLYWYITILTCNFLHILGAFFKWYMLTRSNETAAHTLQLILWNLNVINFDQVQHQSCSSPELLAIYTLSSLSIISPVNWYHTVWYILEEVLTLVLLSEVKLLQVTLALFSDLVIIILIVLIVIKSMSNCCISQKDKTVVKQQAYLYLHSQICYTDYYFRTVLLNCRIPNSSKILDPTCGEMIARM
jgi:hypothetical protein